MLSTTATTLIALALAGAAVADVVPTGPSGSDVFKEGEPCKIEWTGDVSGKWAGMAIQLMSGDNFQMVPVTTVATDQDGNSDGTFEYTCPAVTPNSAIYFYQFTAPGSPNTTWTTRWTLAAADGSTTTPRTAPSPGAPPSLGCRRAGRPICCRCPAHLFWVRLRIGLGHGRDYWAVWTAWTAEDDAAAISSTAPATPGGPGVGNPGAPLSAPPTLGGCPNNNNGNPMNTNSKPMSAPGVQTRCWVVWAWAIRLGWPPGWA
ncbi:hypothetical protein BDZ89DRAFT_1165648 [Hymenopellis radicata]|nr:hypothetical protein BDZ89DRAFT_1165648 [Hymenopellis radicata]